MCESQEFGRSDEAAEAGSALSQRDPVRDPHVERLHYDVNSGEGISYRDPPPVTFSNHLGNFDLRDGKLTITPTEHFAEEEQARQAFEPFLRAWEIEKDLTSNIGTIRFKFARAEVIDRNPPPPGAPRIIRAKASAVCVVGAKATLHVTCSKYPEPLATFRTTPEVEMCYRRWMGYRDGKEPLPAMAYFVLTVLQQIAGGRDAAARVFQIDREILQKIGDLTSMKGDEASARKVTAGNPLQGLTTAEQRWLETAVRRVIHRLGEHASGAPLARIRLADLPPA